MEVEAQTEDGRGLDERPRSSLLTASTTDSNIMVDEPTSMVPRPTLSVETEPRNGTAAAPAPKEGA